MLGARRCGGELRLISSCVALGPVARVLIVLRHIALEEGRDVGHKRVVGVRIRQQRTDRKEHLRDGQGGRPLVLEDVQTDRAVGVDVRVVDFRRELHLRGLEGVVLRELDVQEKNPALVR